MNFFSQEAFIFFRKGKDANIYEGSGINCRIYTNQGRINDTIILYFVNKDKQIIQLI